MAWRSTSRSRLGRWCWLAAGWLAACHGDTRAPAGDAVATDSSDNAASPASDGGAPAAPTPNDVPVASSPDDELGDIGDPSLDPGVSLDAGPTPPVAAEADAGALPPDAPLPEDTALPPGVVSRFPRNNQVAVCPDAPLRLSFGAAVAVGTAGVIRVAPLQNPSAAVDAIDVAAPVPGDTLAGRPVNRVLPIFIDGTDALIYLRRGVLAPETSYVVSVDPGVFVNTAGQPVGAAADWTFTTGPAPGASDTLRVARENGAFCTIQGALDAIPSNNTARVSVDIQPGTYHEMLYLTGKRNVTLRGADAATTTISYPNNERLNPGTAARAMVTALNADGFIIEDLTLENSTPQGGGQAEAVRVRGERVILRRSRFLSRQDTLLLDGLVYVADVYVEGNVDFVWGYGTAYFERSEIKVVARSGVIVQARNDSTQRGYFFVDSRLTSDPGLTNTTFARIDVSEYPNSEVALVDCQVGPHISPEGWTVTGDADTSGLRFLEYRSTDPSGVLLDVSRRHPASRQLDSAQAAALRDRTNVLGGWDPVGPLAAAGRQR